MKKQLSVHGNSWIFYITKTMADFMKITSDSREVILIIKKTTLYVMKNSLNNINEKECYCIKKLVKRGSGYGLVFSQSLLELLDISPEFDSLEILMDEKKLIITKSNN